MRTSVEKLVPRIPVFLALSAVALGVAGPVAPAPAVAQQRAITPDVVYGHKDGMALTYDVFHPAEANGAGILWMVSGGWVSRWSSPERAVGRYRDLLDAGFTVFMVRHGSSPRYKVPDAVADVRRAVEHIRANAAGHGIDADRLGVWGGSAGGHLSLMLGLDPEGPEAGIAAVVAYFPPVDLRSWAGPSERFPALEFDPADEESVSPILFVSADDPPTLLIHGDEDTLVSLSHSERIHEALRGDGVTTDLIVITGGDHGFTDPQHRAEARAAMIGWFEEHLTMAAAAGRR